MTKKFKWFTMRPFAPRHLKKLVVKLQEGAYSEAVGKGFVVDEVRERSATFRYIERNDVTETIQSPLGGQTEYRLVTYNQCIFDLSVDWPQCEIQDGFRLATKVFNLLASHLDFGVVIEDQEVHLSRLVDALRRNTPDIQFVAMVVTDIQVDGHSSARCEISSTEDAFAKIKLITQARAHHLSQIKFRWYINGRECVGSVSSDGRCSLAAHECDLAALHLKKVVGMSVKES